jgi:hypothetical protein
VKTLPNDVTLVGYTYIYRTDACRCSLCISSSYPRERVGKGLGEGGGEGWLDAKRPERLERGGPC